MPSTVTTSVVFTDLVGSTEMAARLGPVRTEERCISAYCALHSPRRVAPK